MFNQHHIGCCAVITPRPVERTSTKLPCNYCRAHLEAIAIVSAWKNAPPGIPAGSGPLHEEDALAVFFVPNLDPLED